MQTWEKNKQYYKFCAYGFLKNLRFFEAFFILFLISRGLSYTQIGILYAVREITINFFEIPSGVIADTFGRKRSLASSFLMYIFSFIIFYTAENFGLFFIAFILYGIGDAFRSGTHKGMIMDYLKGQGWSDQKISYYGHTRAWSQRGSAISALTAGLILFYHGSYSQIFLFSTIPYLVNLLLILSYPRELDRPAPSRGNRLRAMERTFRAFIVSMKNVRVFKLINQTALHSAYMKAVKDYIQPVMLHVAILIPLLPGIARDQQNGLTIGIFYFLIYLFTALASQGSEYFLKGKRSSLILTTLLAGFGFGMACGIFAELSLWIPALIAFFMIYIIENIRKPILTGFVADQSKEEYLTSVLSAQSLLRTVMSAAIAFITGVFADIFGIGLALLFVSTILALIILLLYFLAGYAKTKSARPRG
ncbi:MAG: MFS transporter [Fidelibacterota bacterium]